ncbi:MAG: MFS transporter [Anaerolineae bacterium]|nr:MFS transporter [Anaerolineae bacterium]
MRMHLPPSLRYRRFAIFWVVLLFTWVGNSILIWALPWQINVFTRDPAALGAIGLIRLLPTILASLFAGLIADNFNRRNILLITQSVMGIVALLLGLLTLSGKIQLWHLYALIAINATAFAFDLPARYALTPNLVPRRVLANALGVEVVAFQIGSLVGPILNGWLINIYGQQWAYMGAAGFFMIVVLMLLAIGPVHQQNQSNEYTALDWSAIKNGVNFTFSHTLIFPSMLLDFIVTFLIRADALMPYIANEILNLSAAQYGWLTASPALGAAIAGITISQIRIFRHQGKILLGTAVLIGMCATIFGLSRSFALSLAMLIIIGAADSIGSIVRSAIRQIHTNDALRGRMISVNQIFFMGGPYLGEMKSGYLGALIGVPQAIAIGGVVCVVSVGWIARKMPILTSYDA